MRRRILGRIRVRLRCDPCDCPRAPRSQSAGDSEAGGGLSPRESQGRSNAVAGRLTRGRRARPTTGNRMFRWLMKKLGSKADPFELMIQETWYSSFICNRESGCRYCRSLDLEVKRSGQIRIWHLGFHRQRLDQPNGRVALQKKDHV